MPDGPGRTGPQAAGPTERSAGELTRAVARGDGQALAAFYARWFDPVFAQARSLTRRDESFCLDVVQETMLKVARSIRSMPTESDIARWLSRVVHTTALDLLRRESRRTARERRVSVGSTPTGDAAEATALDERIAWVRARLAELPAEEARLLGMRFFRGATLDAVGATSGVSGDSAHGRIRRTLGRLRTLAKEAFDDHP